MLKREIHSLNNKLRNIGDKREIVMRERQLLQERIETLIGSIGNEVESRKRLRKEINEMNEAFKEELREMAAEQQAADELEECYFSDDDDLVVNTHKREAFEDSDSDEYGANVEDEEAEETVEDVIRDEDEEDDVGAALFENYPEPAAEDEVVDESQIKEDDCEATRETLAKRVEKHNENIQQMRKSNFNLKNKIDRLYDILQSQKEKHHDLRLELTRMLADIQ
jgi:predicted nuclease with TOPRIM domain